MSRCQSFWQVLRAVEELVGEYRAKSRYRNCRFFFRGEYHRYPDGGDVPLPASQCIPSLFRKLCHYRNERKIFYEALRRYPGDFTAGMTTFDMLAKMQHYQVMTRLLDITSDVRLATAMATLPFDDVPSAYNDHTAFISVYAVHEDRIKYTDSDTVSMIANLARLDDEKVKFDDLGSLSYEVARERPGFDWNACGKEVVRGDLQKVWCVLPVLRNERVKLQSGAFLLFGCRDRKGLLRPTFSESDFADSESPSEGIARIGHVAIDGGRKKCMAQELGEFVAMARHDFYPEMPIYAREFQNELEKQEQEEW